MKYWNKHPEVRARCWTYVELDPLDQCVVAAKSGVYDSQLTIRSNIKRMIQTIPSSGKFYANSRGIWFEDSGDALWFKLSRKTV